MTLDLFSDETVPEKARQTIRLRCIRPVYHTETICENTPHWANRRISTSETVFSLFKDLVLETRENFISLHLDSKNRILCYDLVSVGSMTASIVHPREVYKSALLSSASALVFLHNHPSGDPTPSREDIDITKRLKEAGELLGIRVLDHVIIGEERYCSFADRGLL